MGIASVEDVLDTPTVLEALGRRADADGQALALLDAPDGVTRILTWDDLFRRTSAAAAALAHTGLTAGHAVLVLLDAGATAWEVELAVRATGAHVVHVDAAAAAPEVSRLLGALAVRVVVADSDARLVQLAGLDLGAAELLDLSSDSWDDLVRLGETVAAGSVHLPVTREDAGVHLVHVDASGTARLVVPDPPSGSEPRDLLLLAPAGDPWGARLLERHLHAGGSLAWSEDVAALPDVLPDLRPQAVAVARGLQPALWDAIAGARIDGRPWHKHPLDTLRSVAQPPSGRRGARAGRAATEAVAALAGWWGDRLSGVEWAGTADEAVVGLCRGLAIDLQCDDSAGHEVELAPATTDHPTTGDASAPDPSATHRPPEPGPGQADDRPHPTTEGNHPMSNVDVVLKEAMSIDGAQAALLVDYQSGMSLGQAGDPTVLNLDVAAAGNTDVVRSKMRTMESLGLDDAIEDILITLGKAYHLIRLTQQQPGLFLYLVLDKDKSNLAMARHKLASIERTLTI